jgi:UDP-N-acetylmuramate--alanine ligase
VAPVDIKKALAGFKGIQRRFERIIDREDLVFIDDYAHHPSELKVAIDAARTLFPGRKLTGIFQPHLYSRTRDFVDGFAAELDKLDEIILMDIYPARELPIEGVTSESIFNRMKNPNKKLVTKETLMDTLKAYNLEILMTLGAGDIDTFVPKIKELYK